MEQVMESKWRSRPWRIAAWSAGAALMLLPITIQLVSGNFGWSTFDFLFVAVVLLSGCTLFDIAARRAPNFFYLAGASLALAAGFGLIVVNGAVGLVGDEDQGHNLFFLLVILVAIVGFVLARGRPGGASKAMLAAAFTHIVVSGTLMVSAGRFAGPNPGPEIFGLSFFAAMWLGSSWLFRHSAR